GEGVEERQIVVHQQDSLDLVPQIRTRHFNLPCGTSPWNNLIKRRATGEGSWRFWGRRWGWRPHRSVRPTLGCGASTARVKGADDRMPGSHSGTRDHGRQEPGAGVRGWSQPPIRLRGFAVGASLPFGSGDSLLEPASHSGPRFGWTSIPV